VQDSIDLIAVSRLINEDIAPKDVKLAKAAQKSLLEHLVTLQAAYGESDYEEIKALKDDIERKKFKYDDDDDDDDDVFFYYFFSHQCALCFFCLASDPQDRDGAVAERLEDAAGHRRTGPAPRECTDTHHQPARRRRPLHAAAHAIPAQRVRWRSD
jgi:hypothetical protein